MHRAEKWNWLAELPHVVQSGVLSCTTKGDLVRSERVHSNGIYRTRRATFICETSFQNSRRRTSASYGSSGCQRFEFFQRCPNIKKTAITIFATRIELMRRSWYHRDSVSSASMSVQLLRRIGLYVGQNYTPISCASDESFATTTRDIFGEEDVVCMHGRYSVDKLT